MLSLRLLQDTPKLHCESIDILAPGKVRVHGTQRRQSRPQYTLRKLPGANALFTRYPGEAGLGLLEEGPQDKRLASCFGPVDGDGWGAREVVLADISSRAAGAASTPTDLADKRSQLH